MSWLCYQGGVYNGWLQLELKLLIKSTLPLSLHAKVDTVITGTKLMLLLGRYCGRRLLTGTAIVKEATIVCRC